VNCLEFRRQLLIEPQQQGADFLDHAHECPTCGREYRRALEFEKRLSQALTIEPPQGLDSRILLTQQMARRKPRIRTWRRFQIAAGIILAAGVALFVEHLGSEHDKLDALRGEVVAHIEEEPASLLASNESATDRLRPLLATFGLKQLSSLGEVRYAGICDIGERKGIHIVVRGKTQPVTLILLPGERIKAPAQILTSRLEGIIVPTNYGSLAVVADPKEPVVPVLKRVQPAIAMGI